MSTLANKRSSAYWLKVALCFIVPIIILLLPQTTVLTWQTKVFIAATCWFLMWAAFELTNLMMPSLIYPAIFTITGVTTMQVAYSSWLSLIVPTVAAAMIIGNVLSECGLLNRICFWIMAKCGGSFNKTMIALYFACLIISAVTFACALVIIATICFGVCKALNYHRTKEAAIIMMVGMVAASTCRAFVYFPMIMGGMLGSTAAIDPHYTITVAQLFLYNWPVLIYSVLFIAAMLFTLKGKATNGDAAVGKDYFLKQYQKMGKMGAKEKKAAVLTVLLLVSVAVAPSFGIDSMYPFLIVAFLMYLPGIDLGSENSITSVPVGTLFFVASCMGIGTLCGAVGLTEHLAKFLAGFLSGFGPILTLFIILIFGFLANFAMTPMAMVATFGGTLLMLADQLGMSRDAFLYTFNYSTDLVILPYEFVTYLIFFAFGTMTTGQFVKYNAAKCLLFLLFFGVIIIPYWFLAGIL